MSTLAPHEELDGTPETRADLLGRLTELRAAPYFQSDHPAISFVTLADALALDLVNRAVFRTGWKALASRYAELGVGSLLPLDRVWIGARSAKAPAFGGFHYPRQGYRHLQMAAVFTLYGDLTGQTPSCSRLAALDLLRAYAHDCLHWGSYRVYRLWDCGDTAQISRVRYGINFRTVDGRTYSARDTKTARTTRNLGVVMEGASDKEAHMIARAAAEREHVAVLGAGGTDRFAFLDQIGELDDDDIHVLTTRHLRAQVAEVPGSEEYLANMGAYARGVGTRYEAFLREFGGPDANELHRLIVTSMMTGAIDRLSAWLSRRHGPNAFAAIFKAADFDAAETG